MAFNENTRVKIPALLHLSRLGFTYMPLLSTNWDHQTNIATTIFYQSIKKLNKDIEDDEIKRLLEDITLLLDNEDLGKAFYQRLKSSNFPKLIDFADFENNHFHVVTELTYKNGDEEFRPDITILINGMPLAFVEVKKPNNRDGILAERERINTRFANKKFRRFINATQLLVFSNNMEYDQESIVPIQGAFYATPTYDKAIFNPFREEEDYDSIATLQPENEEVEKLVLKDNNLTAIKHSPEFITNKNPLSPTNRILTSMFSIERLKFFLKYSLAYVHTNSGIEKHVMRYPQVFATKAIAQELTRGKKKGIIWHTQGSGKTALAYYNVHYLTDHFQKQGIIPKFYFIVDRLDLLIQATKEFTARGLVVHTVNSKEEFASDIRQHSAIHNHSGKREITVVNIQKFSEDSMVVKSTDYAINVQRIYFLDEVHRSYSPDGSFLANLANADRNAILIGLTGTPLINREYYSRHLFGDYIHKYYYNASISDGYTLKLIREGIATAYKVKLEEVLREIEVLQGDLDRKEIYAHERFVEPMLDYIVADFERSRLTFNDASIGAMVVCDSAEQAKNLYDIFQRKYASAIRQMPTTPVVTNLAAEEEKPYQSEEGNKVRTAALILHDVGDKETRKDWVEDFKDGKIDLLFVFNMLLTGFDARRLKKLYLGRIVKDHNLLQTLTRVNRPYKDFRYGFVVDFADIRKEFEATNKAYFQELQTELGDEMEHYSHLFKSAEEIEEEIAEIKELLLHYNTENAEIFSQQISSIEDKATVLALKKALGNAKNLYNLIRLFEHHDLLDKLDFKKLVLLYNEVSNHLDLLNLKASIENNVDTTNLLNVALENVLFLFRKVSEDELVIADKLKDTLRKTREALANNFDKKDPAFVTLYDELERLFKKKNLDQISQEEMRENIGALQQIYDKVTELNRRNNLLREKYANDAKYARIHKRLAEHNGISKRETQIYEALQGVKRDADEQVLINEGVLKNEGYFDGLMMQLVMDQFYNKQKLKLNPEAARFINGCVVKEYLNEYGGRNTW